MGKMISSLAVGVIGTVILGMPAAGNAAEAVKSEFGAMPDGRTVYAVTLTNGNGIEARIITYGARVQSLVMPGRDGARADIVLGYDGMEGYLSKRQYFGATVGRFANRIANGRFKLDGNLYQLTINDGSNSLHGGTHGFDTRLWRITDVEDGDVASVTMRYVSADGDEGYPGRLTVMATYSLDARNRLTIDYHARTDATTIVNISNHTYWNLGGEGSGTVMKQRLMIPAKTFTPVDATQIPTGEFRDVADTPFDFRRMKTIGEDIRDGRSQQLVIGHGYDINWVVSREPPHEMQLMARAEDPESGRGFALYANQPGLQFYSGNFLDATTIGKSGRIYRQGDAFVLEPQLFPDTPNQPSFGSATLEPGETYHNRIVYQFSTRARSPASDNSAR